MNIHIIDAEAPTGASGKGWWFEITATDGTNLLRGWRRGNKAAVRNHAAGVAKRLDKARSGTVAFSEPIN